MINISKLYLDIAGESDSLRYHRPPGNRKPIVVWNCTRACNLQCAHCYARSDAGKADNELSTEEGKKLIDMLSDFEVPVLLFSGGEPLLRKDVPELAEYAVSKGLRTVVSSNGTLIDNELAAQLKNAGLSYVGISLDGLKQTNDKFRGREGAFDDALKGIRACRQADLKVGLRYTITRYNMNDIDGIFDLLEQENIPRACFYHLVYTGRGAEIAENDLTKDETRAIVDLIIDRSAGLHKRGIEKEILTVDNHCDGPYLYMRMKRENNPRTEDVMKLLKANGGNSTGQGIGCISWDGTVYPDQFWRNHPLGNVREKSFGEIWTDLSNNLLAELKHKHNHVCKRCRECRFINVCSGNFRARGEAATGDPWGFDPACYLTDEEIV